MTLTLRRFLTLITLALAAISVAAVAMFNRPARQSLSPIPQTTPDQTDAPPAYSADGLGPRTVPSDRVPDSGLEIAAPDVGAPGCLDHGTLDFLATTLPESAFAPIALSLLNTTEPGEARERLSAWIEELETDNPRPYLNAYLASSDWTVRRAVGPVLQRSADAHAVNELIRSWHDGVNDYERAQVENLIIGITSPFAEEAVIVALLDPARSSDLGVRRALMLGLGSIGGRIGVATLIDWLRQQAETSGADGPLLASALCAVRSEEGQLLLAAVAENASGDEPIALQQQAVAALFSQPSAVALGAIDRMASSDQHQMSRAQLAALRNTMLGVMGR